MKWDELPGRFDWDRKLSYFLDPANQKDISKEDLQDALAVLASMYCDEFYNLRFLECFVEEELGSDRLDSAIENSISTDSVTDRSAAVLEKVSTEERLKTALGFVNAITKEFDDLSEGEI
ncbi:MAG: hypothetical protein J6U54_13620 [Clostridiales bacterium]|nr:hypothetical protein [Clostridiales bacterium]MBP5774514.1 hypothetical protein [Clostridiales bacterium]